MRAVTESATRDTHATTASQWPPAVHALLHSAHGRVIPFWRRACRESACRRCKISEQTRRVYGVSRALHVETHTQGSSVPHDLDPISPFPLSTYSRVRLEPRLSRRRPVPGKERKQRLTLISGIWGLAQNRPVPRSAMSHVGPWAVGCFVQRTVPKMYALLSPTRYKT